MSQDAQHDTIAPGTARRITGLVLGFAVFALMLASPPPADLEVAGWHVAAVAILMAIFWMTEALPVAATALIPLAAFPILGVRTIGETTAPYANPLVFLFLGGFVIALTMQRWDLHSRIALTLLARAGNRMDTLIAAFMAVTAFLSMWVSNTATTLMMIPIVLSVTILVTGQSSASTPEPNSTPKAQFAPALLLSVAYGASIGGMSTLVGTPPNAFLAAFMLERYGLTIGFAQWLMLGLPLVIVMLFIVWVLLTRVIFRLKGVRIGEASAVIDEHHRALGPMTHAQKLTACLFVTTAVLWVTRPWIAKALGWTALDDTVIAIGASLAAFMIPVNLRRGIFLMDWDHAHKLPWGILILFGGGLTLASAIAKTGLAGWIGAQLTVIVGLPPVLIILAVVTLIIFLTELTSNTATTATFLPVVAALALSLGENPLLLAVPAALAASCAFMMPVATPPNAIVFGTGHLSVPQMARAGFLLNIAGIAVITLVAYSLLLIVFGVEPGILPVWLTPPTP
ncbi:MAG: sodium-dependent dicarboxylate transporter 2/3/5 [Alphaproteobacteria bacterium]|jgi:sodium-dependent dicarboxylate transporter 2/3/5